MTVSASMSDNNETATVTKTINADNIVNLAFELPSGLTGPGIPSGGTANQFLVKSSSTDYDTEWKALPKYELIGSITLSEATSDFERTQDLNSNAYQLLGALLIIETVGGASSGTATVRFTLSNNGHIDSAQSIIATSARYSCQKLYQENGLWEGYYIAPRTSSTLNGARTYFSLSAMEYDTENYPYIVGIRVYTNDTVTIPAGSIFKIYGIKA